MMALPAKDLVRPDNCHQGLHLAMPGQGGFGLRLHVEGHARRAEIDMYRQIGIEFGVFFRKAHRRRVTLARP